MTRGVRGAIGVVLAVVLAGGLAGCDEDTGAATKVSAGGVADGSAQPAADGAGTGSAEPASSTPPAPTPSAAGSPTAPDPAAAATRSPGKPAAEPTPARPPKSTPPTRPVQEQVTVAVTTSGGRLSVREGAPAREFTVTLRNDTAEDHEHLAVGLAMEPYWGEGDLASWPLAVERWDAASGSWRKAEIVIATDVSVLYRTSGGSALPRGAERKVRYRIAATDGRPSASTYLGVYAVVTDLPREATAKDRLGGYGRVALDVNKT